MRSGPLLAAVASVALLVTAPAAASDAGRLFDEGVALLDQNRVAEACPKLEASQRLEPAAGTLLNLAACYERSGRRARALATFKEASDAARARGRADWQKVADEHVRTLTVALPKLTIVRGETPGLEVRLDGERVADIELGIARPVDPGRHTIAARSAGRRPFSATIVVDESTTLAIPLLEAAADRLAPAPPTPSAGVAPRMASGIALVSAGAVTLALGAVSVVIASSALDDAKRLCPDYPSRCARAADDPNGRAETWSSVATIAFVAGGALAAGGAVLLLWPTRAANARLGFDGGRLLLGGRF